MQAAPESLSIVQIYLSAVVTLGTAAALWTAKTVFHTRDDVREVKKTVGDDERKTGLVGKVEELTDRVESLEDWQTALEAVKEAERRQYDGPERRRTDRRLRDQVLHKLADESM